MPATAPARRCAADAAHRGGPRLPPARPGGVGTCADACRRPLGPRRGVGARLPAAPGGLAGEKGMAAPFKTAPISPPPAGGGRRGARRRVHPKASTTAPRQTYHTGPRGARVEPGAFRALAPRGPAWCDGARRVEHAARPRPAGPPRRCGSGFGAPHEGGARAAQAPPIDRAAPPSCFGAVPAPAGGGRHRAALPHSQRPQAAVCCVFW